MDKYTILLVDDEEEVIQAIIRKINWEELGFSVVGYADNGIKALEMIEESQPDVVMTDIKMPVMTGLDATVIIRKENQNIPIIMQTAYAFSTDKENAMKCGATEVLVKPITLSILRNCLTNYFPQLKW